MKKSLKKHLLSNYAIVYDMFSEGNTIVTECVEISDIDEFSLAHKTETTKAVDLSDLDEFVVDDTTALTHSIEVSDPDEFVMSDGTTVTRTIEISDLDDMYSGTTKNTFTIENSDDDFLLM